MLNRKVGMYQYVCTCTYVCMYICICMYGMYVCIIMYVCPMQHRIPEFQNSGNFFLLGKVGISIPGIPEFDLE